ncbi:MAG: hypothetical protein JO119_17300 [Acidobacteria bacterium]|nr:hypothetical protein [Acidobacteriota bacterium]
MRRVALGIRVHSGWGALVAVSYENGSIEILDRRRVAITGTTDYGANQPYHAARNLPLPEADSFIAAAFATAHSAASSELRQVLDVLRAQKSQVAGCAILMAAGRTLPPLEKILAAHPLLHTAEGVFFREAFAKACESNNVAVAKVKERELENSLKEKLGREANPVKKKVQLQGHLIGSPWTTDQKNATLAALLLLSSPKKPAKRK